MLLPPRSWRTLGRGLAILCLSVAAPASPSFAQSKKPVSEPAAVKPVGGDPVDPKESTDEQTPADLLKSKGFRRSGSTYVLGTETIVQRKLAAARLQLSQFRQASAQQASFEMGLRDRKAFEEQLVQQRTFLNQQLAEVDRQTPSIDLARNNEAVNNARNDLVDQHNRLVTLMNETTDRLRLLDNQGEGSELKQKVAQEVARYREAYMQSIIDVRELVNDTQKSYEDLSKNPEVTKALQAINDKTKLKVKLGPSREYLAAVANFAKIEGSVLTEMVEVRKEGGVYWLDVTFNGKVTKPMVFDTGAGVTSLSSSLAAEIGLKPKPSDPTMKLETADGTVVEAKQMTVGSMRVGKFTVKNVVCAIMPEDKGEVAPLLGQSFHRHFTYKFTPESGRLTISQVEEGDQATRTSSPTRKGRATSKSKRATRSQPPSNLDAPLEETP